MKRKPPDRDEVLFALKSALEPLEFVHAAWEAGAISWGRLDDWSDIDLNVDAADDRVADVFPVVERALRRMAPIEVRVPIPFPPEHAYQQVFYRLRGTPPTLLIDLAVFRHSAEDKYLDPVVHGPPLVLFEKMPVFAIARHDRRALLRKIRQRKERLRRRVALFACFVEKEEQRGHLIETISNYQRILLDTLLELLRIRYRPEHFEFGVRYVHDELPGAVIRRLEPLYCIRDAADLRRKRKRVERWIREELS